jgi:hypothetical protein
LLTDGDSLMDRKLKYGLCASVVLWPILAAAVAACRHSLPTAAVANPFAGPRDTSHNWVGQELGAAYGNALLLLVVIYAAKFLIGRMQIKWVRVYCFVLLVIASLPYIWLLVEVDWQNPHVYPVSCWVYDPIGIWVIPAVTFAIDTAATSDLDLRWYLGRSLLEFLLVIPWMFAWTFFSFFLLGGGWI